MHYTLHISHYTDGFLGLLLTIFITHISLLHGHHKNLNTKCTEHISRHFLSQLHCVLKVVQTVLFFHFYTACFFFQQKHYPIQLYVYVSMIQLCKKNANKYFNNNQDDPIANENTWIEAQWLSYYTCHWLWNNSYTNCGYKSVMLLSCISKWSRDVAVHCIGCQQLVLILFSIVIYTVFFIFPVYFPAFTV